MILFTIPAKAVPSNCKLCNREIFRTMTGKQKTLFLDASVKGGVRPTYTEPGQGSPHWEVCKELAHKKGKV